MGVNYNPKIISNDLVLVADAKNPKSVTSSTTEITNAAQKARKKIQKELTNEKN